jgi:glycolate oxidase
MLPATFIDAIERIAGPSHLKRDDAARAAYGADALEQVSLPDLVVLPGSTTEVAAIARQCHEMRVPLTVRGAGTGYSGGAVPLRGGIVLSLERMNRILEIDQLNLLAIVEPNVITGDLQDAVERVGLFYPPDPASLRRSSIGGNVAECAGGPRAFKYGTTKRYVLGLEAVLPTGDVINTGSKCVKDVVGYDLTHLLVGSEGTLAIITKAILRLIPRPPAQATLRATFTDIESGAAAVTEMITRRVVPATLELMDRESLDAATKFFGVSFAPPGTGAVLLIEVDGMPGAIADEAARVREACAAAGATDVRRAVSETEREELWRLRRDLSYALKAVASLKLNNDIVVPRGRVPELYQLVEELRRTYRLPIPSFGHAGDGNIHVNIMVNPDDADQVARGRAAQRRLFEGVIALEGAITGEHGIGYAKAQYVRLELSEIEIALMKRIKQAFDPHGILNPGKIFPE